MHTPAETIEAEEFKTPEIGSRLRDRVTISKWKGHQVYKWRASYVESGKYRRKGFKTKTAAEEWAEKHEEETHHHGTAATLTPAERSAVFDTRDRLAALGVDLRTAIEHAADFFERSQKSATVAELVAEVIDSRRKANRSHRYLYDLENRLGKFGGAFGDRSVATITRNEIRDWIHGLKLAPAGANNYRRVLVVAFNDAIESGYILENPAAKVKKAKEIETEIGILTSAKVARLLEKANPEILPAIAIGAFAGIRDAELKRMDWSEIELSKGFIRIKATNTKSARNRLIPISSNLNSWLAPYVKAEGKLWPENGRKLHQAARRAARFGKPGTETEKEKAKGIELKPWPENGLRHSFATYHLAHHQNAGELALQMGHTDTKIIFQHYRELVTPEEAAGFGL